MSAAPLRPLSFGEILDGSFTLYRRHFLTMFLTALVGWTPIAVLSAATVDPNLAAQAELTGSESLVALASLGALLLLWAALTRQTARAYLGERVTLGDGYNRAVQAFFPLLGAGIVIFFVLLALIFLMILALGILGAIMVPTGSAAAVGVFSVLAALAFLVVLAAFFSVLFAVPAAAVVEGKGPLASIARSHRLAKGALLRIFAMWLVAWLILTLPVAGLAMLTGADAMLGGAAAAGQVSDVEFALVQLLTVLMWSLTLPFFVGCFVLLYYDRRVRTEAHDLEGMVDSLAVAG
jgi:hypothetical protein